ncbi:MAG: helix-turn-helix domain-containing protein [Chthoniobacterales bacterium]|nr:helix-turn-helix domain-containing protein [Chthoniobacterales bacterium]
MAPLSPPVNPVKQIAIPGHVLKNIASRIRFLRLERGWSQQEIASRAAICLATYQLFERTGKISFQRLYRIAVTLQRTKEIEDLFQPLPIRSIDELIPKLQRQRGRPIT